MSNLNAKTVSLVACLAALPIASFGQEPARAPSVPGPFSEVAVVGAPFSATATTHIRHPRYTGAPTTTMRVYRDSAGRVRIDYEVPSTASAAATAARKAIYRVIPDPTSRKLYTVDPMDETIRLIPFGWEFNAAQALGLPIAAESFRIFHMPESGNAWAESESLGVKHVEGVSARGRRVGDSSGKRLDEQWESPELGMVLYARHSQPQAGIDIEYRLHDIRRVEPSQRLFELPPTYRKLHDELQSR